MPTLYKPSVWRAGRLVYESIDPSQPKREVVKALVGLVVAIALLVFWSFFLTIISK